MTKLIPLATPGEILKEEFLDEMGLKPGTLAKAVGVDRSTIKKIIDGNRGITADMSMRLGLFFDLDPKYWLNIQTDYDMRIAKRERWNEFKQIVTPYQSMTDNHAPPSALQ